MPGKKSPPVVKTNNTNHWKWVFSIAAIFLYISKMHKDSKVFAIKQTLSMCQKIRNHRILIELSEHIYVGYIFLVLKVKNFMSNTLWLRTNKTSRCMKPRLLNKFNKIFQLFRNQAFLNKIGLETNGLILSISKRMKENMLVVISKNTIGNRIRSIIQIQKSIGILLTCVFIKTLDCVNELTIVNISLIE